MEQVIKEQVKKECNKICVCMYEETKESIRVYPYAHIITSRLIVVIDMIKEEYSGMIDYYIGYDGLRREVYISVVTEIIDEIEREQKQDDIIIA